MYARFLHQPPVIIYSAHLLTPPQNPLHNPPRLANETLITISIIHDTTGKISSHSASLPLSHTPSLAFSPTHSPSQTNYTYTIPSLHRTRVHCMLGYCDWSLRRNQHGTHSRACLHLISPAHSRSTPARVRMCFNTLVYPIIMY